MICTQSNLLQYRSSTPTNNAPLINLKMRSDAEILLISMESAYKSVPNVQKHVPYAMCKYSD